MANMEGESFFITDSLMTEAVKLKAEEVFKYKHQTMVGMKKGEEGELLKLEE